VSIATLPPASPADRRARLHATAVRTQAMGLARDRVLPVLAPLAPLLPEGALVRGKVVACTGGAAVSAALALTAEPTREGSWAGVVGLAGVGLAAAAELGVALERLVLVAAPRGDGEWAEVLAALTDGVDVVVAASPPRLGAGRARRLQARVQARGGVLVLVGADESFAPDLSLRAEVRGWEGVGADGSGHLMGRRVALELGGRRLGAPRRAEVWLPGPDGALAPVATPVVDGRRGAEAPLSRTG
jgi:hypothetical protein